MGIRRQLRERLIAAPPDVFIGVDAPDFNLALEADLRASGTKTVHFVCPSVWAWRPQRMELLRRAADHVLCIFPFEPELLQREGIASTFVGHPLAQLIPLQPDRAAARRVLGLTDEATVVAILPGSRRSEIDYLAPLFFAAAVRLLAARHWEARATLAVRIAQPGGEESLNVAAAAAICLHAASTAAR